jgi:D-3-phosphoglycerate dehydrogenase
MGTGLTGRKLGLIGAGGIGQELIPLARPFFEEIIVCDPYVDESVFDGLGVRKRSFEKLLAEADFVTALCPLNDETRHMMNAGAFAAMKRDACFINVARGPVHDEAALIEALRHGGIAGAALDVTEAEPLDPASPLTAMENVILTPHSLCWTDECFEAIARSALRAIVDVSLGLEPAHPVRPG